MVRKLDCAEPSLAARREARRLGIAMAAMMPMIATTIKSSIREKPFWPFFCCISFRCSLSRRGKIQSQILAPPALISGFVPRSSAMCQPAFYKPCAVSAAAARILETQVKTPFFLQNYLVGVIPNTDGLDELTNSGSRKVTVFVKLGAVELGRS